MLLMSAEQLKALLLENLDDQNNVKNMAGAIEAISLIEKMELTKEALEATRLGMLLNLVRQQNKATWPDISQRCRALIRKWQQLIAMPSSGSGSGFNSSGVSPALQKPLLSSEGPHSVVPSPPLKLKIKIGSQVSTITPVNTSVCPNGTGGTTKRKLQTDPENNNSHVNGLTDPIRDAVDELEPPPRKKAYIHDIDHEAIAGLNLSEKTPKLKTTEEIMEELEHTNLVQIPVPETNLSAGEVKCNKGLNQVSTPQVGRANDHEEMPKASTSSGLSGSESSDLHLEKSQQTLTAPSRHCHNWYEILEPLTKADVEAAMYCPSSEDNCGDNDEETSRKLSPKTRFYQEDWSGVNGTPNSLRGEFYSWRNRFSQSTSKCTSDSSESDSKNLREVLVLPYVDIGLPDFVEHDLPDSERHLAS